MEFLSDKKNVQTEMNLSSSGGLRIKFRGVVEGPTSEMGVSGPLRKIFDIVGFEGKFLHNMF